MTIEVTTITLAFDPLLEGFPNERLRDLLADREILAVDSFSFERGGVPYWSLCITYRRLRGETGEDEEQPGEVKKAGDGKAQKDAFRELLSELDERERVAYDRLRGWRRETAHAEGHAPYMVCNDRALLEIVRRRPRTRAGLLEVKGIGEKKVAAYGGAILEVLHGEAIRSARREAIADSDQVAGSDGLAHGHDESDAEKVAAQPGASHGPGGDRGASASDGGGVPAAEDGRVAGDEPEAEPPEESS